MGVQNGLKLRDLTLGYFDSSLSYGTLKVSHMFVQEAMHLQYLPIKIFRYTGYVDDPLSNTLHNNIIAIILYLNAFLHCVALLYINLNYRISLH